MSQVDWSKAPEDATHYEPDGSKYSAGWMRYYSHGEWAFYGSSGNWVRGTKSCEVSRSRESTFIARPQPWNGVGLPPVGTVCEYLDALSRWNQVRITAHAELGICFRTQNGSGENYAALTAQFRPIKTQAQIEADAREAEIDAIEKIAAKAWRDTATGGDMIRDISAAIYESGYRLTKQDGE
jgi:hypothetical protein